MKETRILLLRHAETAAPESIHGNESDVGLGDRGREQAEAVGRRLAAERPDVLVSSAMRRALRTAEAIARVCGLDVAIEPTLHERGMGPFSGRPRADVIDSLRETLRRWMAGDLSYAPAGTESYAQVRDRVVPALHRVVERYSGKTVVVVAHGMVIRVLLTSILTEPGIAGLDRVKIDNVAVNDLRWDGSEWRAVSLNQALGGDLDTFAW